MYFCYTKAEPDLSLVQSQKTIGHCCFTTTMEEVCHKEDFVLFVANICGVLEGSQFLAILPWNCVLAV